MTFTAVSIPESLYDRLKQFSEQRQISVEQFVAAAVMEKMSVIEREGYIGQRARRADEQKYVEALSHVPDVEPASHDKL
jgi:hypothetical protein